MDLNRIRRKIDDDKYTSLEQMTADVNLLCDNAQVYLLNIKFITSNCSAL
jgi:hypothetical protein